MEESNGLIVKWSINTIAVIGKTDASTSLSLSFIAPNQTPHCKKILY